MDRDQALIDEAYRRVHGADWPNVVSMNPGTAKMIAAKALELERFGWQLTDPDVLAVREIVAAYTPLSPHFGEQAMAGEFDDAPGFIAALAAYRKHKGGGNG